MLSRPGARTASLGRSTVPVPACGHAGHAVRRPVEEDEIRRHAYEIWEREGRPEGRAEEHWRRAKTEPRRCRRRIAPAVRAAKAACLRAPKARDAPVSPHP
nr:DUF2934 domain-containing protein [Inquilinus limosus]